MLVDGVTVEYRDADGSIGGAQARVIDFDDPANNDWLAVNQFTVVERQAHAAAGRGAVRQRPAAGGARAEERGRRGRHDLDRVPAAPDLQGARSRRSSRTTRLLVISDGVEARIGTLTRRTRVVQALADHRGRDAGRRAPAGAAGGARGRVRAAALPRPAARLHRLRGRRRRAARQEDGRLPPVPRGATWRWTRRCAPRELRARGPRGGGAGPLRGRRSGRAASPATGASAWSGTRRARARA